MGAINGLGALVSRQLNSCLGNVPWTRWVQALGRYIGVPLSLAEVDCMAHLGIFCDATRCHKEHLKRY